MWQYLAVIGALAGALLSLIVVITAGRALGSYIGEQISKNRPKDNYDDQVKLLEKPPHKIDMHV